MKRKSFHLIGFLFLLVAFSACEALEELGPESIYDTWYCKESSELYNQTNYYVDLSQHPSDEDKIVLDNFYNLGIGLAVVANLSGLSIVIPSQVVDGNTITGSGSIDSDYRKINFTYTVDDGGGIVDQVSAEYSKL